jgi:dihydrodipicolinate synthase/N-acetylneuraminate lyase
MERFPEIMIVKEGTENIQNIRRTRDECEVIKIGTGTD